MIGMFCGRIKSTISGSEDYVLQDGCVWVSLILAIRDNHPIKQKLRVTNHIPEISTSSSVEGGFNMLQPGYGSSAQHSWAPLRALLRGTTAQQEASRREVTHELSNVSPRSVAKYGKMIK